MAELQKTVLPCKGLYVGLSTTINHKQLFLFVWADCNRRYFVLLCLSMAQGTLFSRVRWHGFLDNKERHTAERVRVQIPLPKATEIYFEGCGKINKHNRT